MGSERQPPVAGWYPDPEPGAGGLGVTAGDRQPKGIGPVAWIRVFDPESGRILTDVVTGHGRGAIAATDDALWVANTRSRSLTKLDSKTTRSWATVKLGAVPTAIAAGRDSIWVGCRNGWLYRVPRSGQGADGVARLGNHLRALAISSAGVWSLRDSGELSLTDLETYEAETVANVGHGARHLAASDGSVWVTTARGRKLVRVESTSGEIESATKLSGRAIGLCLVDGSPWAPCRHGWRHPGFLAGFDAATGALSARIPLTHQPYALAAGDGAVWVAYASGGWEAGGPIERIELGSGRVEQRMESTRWPVDRLTVAGGRIVATMHHSPPLI